PGSGPVTHCVAAIAETDSRNVPATARDAPMKARRLKCSNTTNPHEPEKMTCQKTANDRADVRREALHRQTIMDSVPRLLPPAIPSAAVSFTGSHADALKIASLTKHRLEQPADPDRRREEQPE